MKKVILSLVLVSAMAVSFTSCKEKEAEVTETEVMEEVTAPVEEAVEVMDSTATQAVEATTEAVK